MQFSIAALALAGFAAAVLQERSVDPASASLALFGALPTSLAGVAITNPAAAATIIQGEFATGTPSWFGKLPPDVQTYFLTAQGAAVPTGAAGTGTGSSANATTTGKYNNGTTSATGTATTSSGTKLTTSTASTTGASSSAAKASTSSGGASLPTGVVGAGIAGAAGLVAMLAL